MDSQTLMNWLTAAVAVATGWLAIETNRMARAAKVQVDLQSQPFLSFRGFEIASAQAANLSAGAVFSALRLGLRLSNPGQVLVQYEVQTLQSSLGNISLPSSAFNTTGGAIHPKEDTLFLLPFAEFAISTGGPAPSFDVDFSISYWATPESKKMLTARVRLELLSLQPFQSQWVYLQGPTYA